MRLFAALALVGALQQEAPERLDAGRLTIVFYPQDRALARNLLEQSVRQDSFPGFPRPVRRALIAIAPDHARFRAWIGPAVPEWGAAVAFPESGRIVMQGRSASAQAGDPREVLRHELAHLAVHEHLGSLAPRWFDEGYASVAAHEWRRQDALETNFALAVGGMPTLDELDAMLVGGSSDAEAGYAFAHRAVSELTEIAGGAGLTRFLGVWRSTMSMEKAMRGAFGLTVTGFEKQWQERTRKRYGALALLSNLALAGAALSLLLLPLYLSRRRRMRRRLEAMRAADARAEREAREGLLALLLNPSGGDAPSGSGGSSPS